MPLTNEEFAHLEKARVAEMRIQTPKQKTMLRLAFEHLNDLQDQQKRALSLIDQLVAFRNESLCWRVPAFFAVQWARVKSWFR